METRNKALSLRTLGLFLVPVVLLAGVIGLFLASDGAGLNIRPAVPIEHLTIERTILSPEVITLDVQNTGPGELTLSQAIVRDAVVPFHVTPGATIPRLGKAVVTIPYPWIEAEAYGIKLFSANAVPFETAIEFATATKTADGATWGSLALVGLYVGVIPVFLGIFWLPALRKMGKTTFAWLMALTVGLLLYLGVDAVNEALEGAAAVGGPFQGVGLVAIGIVATALALYAVGQKQRAGQNEQAATTGVALMIAIGIGLHNFGEGLAIGAAFSVGAATLGTFLVIGFILQNITEGLGIVAPIVKQKVTFGRLALLGLIGGAPAIVGAWIGGFVYQQGFSVLFLAIGAGAVFEVAFEIARLIRPQFRSMPFVTAGGVLSGMLLLYLTGIAIK